VAFIGDEIATCAPALSNGAHGMQQRRRTIQTQPLEVRLAAEAKSLREAAQLLPPGAVREAALRKARRMEITAGLSKWLRAPGLKGPV
jgi:hypothetical protein